MELSLKYALECNGAAACEELLREADRALEKAKEQEAARARLKIWVGKTCEHGKRPCSQRLRTRREELREQNEEVFYHKNCVQNMAPMLMSSDDPDILGKAHGALDKATNRSCYGIKGLQKKLEFMPSGSEVGSITGDGLHKQQAGKRGAIA